MTAFDFQSEAFETDSGTNNNFVHPMHVPGGPFEVVARDGAVLPQRCLTLMATKRPAGAPPGSPPRLR